MLSMLTSVPCFRREPVEVFRRALAWVVVVVVVVVAVVIFVFDVIAVN